MGVCTRGSYVIKTCPITTRLASGDLKAKKHGHSTFGMASEIAPYIEAWPDAPVSPPKQLG
jgi:hypothetical protein